MTAELKTEIAAGVMTLSMARAPYNLLTLKDLSDFRDAFELAGAANSKVQAIVIQSLLPKVFSMGLDPAELLPKSPEGRAEHFDMLAQMNLAALRCGRPMVCVVNGAAMAAGAVLAALSDIRIFHKADAKFSFSETKVNLPVPKFIQNLITRTIHPNAVMDIIVCARSLDTQSALDCDFAQHTYESADDLKATLHGILGRVLRLNPQVISASMQAMNSQWIKETELFCAAAPQSEQGRKSQRSEFQVFLTDEFFGKALHELVHGRP